MGDDGEHHAAHLRAHEVSSRRALDRIRTSKLSAAEDFFAMDNEYVGGHLLGSTPPRAYSRGSFGDRSPGMQGMGLSSHSSDDDGLDRARTSPRTGTSTRSKEKDRSPPAGGASGSSSLSSFSGIGGISGSGFSIGGGGEDSASSSAKEGFTSTGSLGRSSFGALSRAMTVMTEDEVCAIQYDDYLSKSALHKDGTKMDPRDVLFESIPQPFIETEEFQRVTISETAEEPDEDTAEAIARLRACIALRDKYINAHPTPPQDLKPPFNSSTKQDVPPSPGKAASRHPNDYRRRAVPIYNVFDEPLPAAGEAVRFEMIRGIMHVLPPAAAAAASPTANSVPPAAPCAPSSSTPTHPPTHPPTPPVTAPSLHPVASFDDFLTDFMTLRRAVFCGPVISYSYTRLELLAARYSIHVLLNETRELVAQKSVPHRDFYNVRKVDTHVHHSACMSQKHLLRFIKHKLRFDPHEVVIVRDGKHLTLGEVFMSLRLTAYDLSIDTLDMHAHNTFNRFDRFNLKYNPAGQSRLREIFLKTDNLMQGKYLAEITREVMGDLEASKYQLVEWRVSIYGRSQQEWTKLSHWFFDNRLAHANVRWLIQIPRLFANYVNAEGGSQVNSFQEFLSNVFAPLFEVSRDPASNPALHFFLETVVGIDSVDDESKPEHGHLNSGPGSVPTPEAWTEAENPPYGYWMFFFYANLLALNSYRASRGLCTFEFRPHCGEAGDLDHLVSAYLCAHKINHGILLRKNSTLQYLYYLSQVGIAMSPLSNNKLFLDYHKNPFPRYFQQGLHVSLSTDDPLMLHYTKDPLLEEFSVAAQVWKLSSADQCEIARNSVLQSGWERRYKLHFLGHDLSDIRETNVPKIRLLYRQETLRAELAALGL